jgi:hypothetical protein
LVAIGWSVTFSIGIGAAVIAGASVAPGDIVGSSVASSVGLSLLFDIGVAPSLGPAVIDGDWVAVGEVHGCGTFEV